MPGEKRLSNDDNRQVIQIAKGFQTLDDSDSPNNSPLTVSDTVITIKVPYKAIAFVYQVANAAMRISEISAMTHYVTIRNGSGDALECSELDYIYVKRDTSTDAVLNFYFKTL